MGSFKVWIDGLTYCFVQLNLYFAWNSAADDEFWYAAMRDSVNRLRQVAIQEGIYKPDFTQYPNYSITNTTAEALYGPENTRRLREIRKVIDPKGVMDLAGGFVI
jgi:FAD/FMN-containing dehydrogenase